MANSSGVMAMKPSTIPEYQEDPPARMAYDEADWVDWDHWQTVEEMQDFLDGVHDRPQPGEPLDPADDDAQVARQLPRYGLQADG